MHVEGDAEAPPYPPPLPPRGRPPPPPPLPPEESPIPLHEEDSGKELPPEPFAAALRLLQLLTPVIPRRNLQSGWGSGSDEWVVIPPALMLWGATEDWRSMGLEPRSMRAALTSWATMYVSQPGLFKGISNQGGVRMIRMPQDPDIQGQLRELARIRGFHKYPWLGLTDPGNRLYAHAAKAVFKGSIPGALAHLNTEH